MACIKVLSALVTVLAVSACGSEASNPAPSATSIDQKCTETATTGDSYRYCMQLGLEQAGLAPSHIDDGDYGKSAPVAAALTSD